MDVEDMNDPAKRARMDAPPGLASDSVLQEILTTVRSTDGRITRMGVELEETKQLSAKAVTMATATQDEVRNLSTRVDALERDTKSTASSSNTPDPWASWNRAARDRSELQSQPVARSKDRFGQMGGEKGSSIIMGGFPRWSRRAVLERAFADVKAQLHGDLYHRIEKVVYPGTRGHLLNIDLVCEDNPRDTRLEMFAFVKRFRESNVKIRIGEQEYEIWTAAARPPAIRAQDRSVTLAVQVCKKLLAKVGNVEELIEVNYSQGRIWWEDALIAQRSYQNPEKVDFRIAALQKLDRTITAEGIEKLRSELEKEQEKKRQEM